MINDKGCQLSKFVSAKIQFHYKYLNKTIVFIV